VDAEEFLIVVLPLVTTVGLLALVALWIARRSRLKELEIRERIALIEKGIVPPPELSTGGVSGAARQPPARADRFRTAGILLVGLGFALMLLISVAFGAEDAGYGVGGAVVAVGLAAIANSVFSGRRDPVRPAIPAEADRK
jgi:hypothetical protein